MQITLDDVLAHRPDVLLPPDPEFADAYLQAVEQGREIAARSSVAFVAICRNAMPWLPMTLRLVEEAAACFRDWRAFVFENDSEDDTKDALIKWRDHGRRQVSLNINHRPHLNTVVTQERTIALAEYREQCRSWVSHGSQIDYVCVFDTDPWGGFSVEGILTSLAWMHRLPGASCMASYSWAEVQQPHGRMAIHYDAFAARLNHWQRRDQQWFHMWHPPVGSPPIKFNSAFGQLAVYRASQFVAARYAGYDCEHVALHRTMQGDVYLNPSSRCVSFWVPNHGGQDSND